MSNLTQKWKNGELEDGRYYFRHNDNSTPFAWFGSKKVYDGYSNDEVEEVLAPVPSYEEYLTMKDCAKMVFEAAERETKLKQKLSIATKGLQDMADGKIPYTSFGWFAKELMKQIEDCLK